MLRKLSIAKIGDATNLFPLTVDKKKDAHVMSREINSEITKIAWDSHNSNLYLPYQYDAR